MTSLIPDSIDLEKILSVARDTALEAGGILAEGYAQPKSIRYKGDIDLVTQYDLASEKVILSRLKSAFPDHEILAEESGEAGPQSPYRWYIDPLDGTTNFAHQLPIFAVSIAFSFQGEVTVGVVLNPVSGELFTAVRGKGAELNGQPIRVSDSRHVSESLLVTGFPYNFEEILESVMGRFRSCLRASRDVACGRYFLETVIPRRSLPPPT